MPLPPFAPKQAIGQQKDRNMLRKIVSVTSRTTVGKAMVLGVVCSFVAGCGSSIGPIDVPSVPSIGAPSLPGFGSSRRAQQSGVFAAPGSEWGHVSAAGQNFAGLVVADEPRAALAAQRVLEQGGSAGDAVTALYFTLAATNPAAASLGGGGICLIHDPERGLVQSIDFLPRAPADGGPVAIPGSVSGIAQIHAGFGTLSWSDVVDPAAVVAASHPMSRTLARRLDTANANFRGSNRLRRILTNNGLFIDEGEPIVQSNLAGTIGIIANRGPQDMYTGELAYRFIEEAGEGGARITTIDMQSYRPNVTTAQAIQLPGGQTAYIPAGATGAGFFFPEMTQKSLRGLPQNLTPGTPAAASIQREAASVLAESGVSAVLPSDFGSTSFAVTDQDGLTIACGLTMNGAFGTADLGRSSGIIHARSPSDIEYGLSGVFLTPLIITGGQDNELSLAAASAGGPDAPAALLYTAINAPTQGLEQAMTNNGSHLTATVNAISCEREAGDRNRVCRIGVDPRGSGLGAEAVR